MPCGLLGRSRPAPALPLHDCNIHSDIKRRRATTSGARHLQALLSAAMSAGSPARSGAVPAVVILLAVFWPGVTEAVVQIVTRDGYIVDIDDTAPALAHSLAHTFPKYYNSDKNTIQISLEHLPVTNHEVALLEHFIQSELSATTWAEQVLSTAEPDQRCRLLIAADYLCMQELKVAIVSTVHTWAHIGDMRNWLWPQNEILHEFVGDYAPFCRLLLGAETFSEDIRRMKIEEQVRDIVIGRGGDVDLVNDAMYDYGPDVNFLQEAVLTGKVAIVEELVKVPGINVNDVNNQLGTTPLEMAIQGYGGMFPSAPRNSVDLVRALLKAPDIDVNLGSALHYAVKSLDRGVLVPLLVQVPGIVVNARNRYGYTPLDVAVEWDLPDLVEFLLNVPGIEVNGHENSKSTLHRASRSMWETGIVERLLKVPGIKVNALDADGWTPLQVAIDEGRIDIVEVLLRDARIDVNVPDKLSGTPLHAAVQKGNLKVVELLLNRPEIKINSRNWRNETPRTIAKGRGLRDIVKALKHAVQAQRNSKLRSYARRMLPGQGGGDASNAH